MKAPKILTSIYLFLHPLSEQIETTIEERESSGWLLVFFLWASSSKASTPAKDPDMGFSTKTWAPRAMALCAVSR